MYVWTRLVLFVGSFLIYFSISLYLWVIQDRVLPFSCLSRPLAFVESSFPSCSSSLYSSVTLRGEESRRSQFLARTATPQNQSRTSSFLFLWCGCMQVSAEYFLASSIGRPCEDLDEVSHSTLKAGEASPSLALFPLSLFM